MSPFPSAPGDPDEAAQLRNELGLLKQKYLELRADLGRVRDHRDAAIELARREERQRILEDVVGAVDAIEQALRSDPDRDSPWFEGTLGILRQVAGVLERNRVHRLAEAGVPFDPTLHEAVSTVSTSSIPEGTVVEVLRAGYRFSDGSLLRPARVSVAQRPQTATANRSDVPL